MATESDLILQVGLNQTRIAKQLASMEARMLKTARKSEENFRKSNEKAAASFQKIDKAVEKTGRNIAGLRNVLVGAFSAREVQQYADAWTVAGNKIAAASTVANTSARSLSEINDIATETRSGITETADLYAKLLRSTAGVAKSEEEVARATELVNKAFKAGGAAASEQAAGILQLAQGLSSGVLQGDELRSIRENAPIVAQAIANEFGVTIGKLKELGAEGELTSDRVFRAILNAQPDIEAAFAKTQSTIGEGFTRLKNAITEYVGAADDSVGATEKLAGALGALAENIDLVITAGTLLGARFIGPVLGRMLGQSLITITAAQRALAGLATGAGAAASSVAVLRGALALLGGPVGAVIVALTALPMLIETTGERLRSLEGAGDSASDALREYAAASKAAADEQEKLGGKVKVATQEILNQSRANLQASLTELRQEYEKTIRDMRGQGLFDGSQARSGATFIESLNRSLDNSALSGIAEALHEINEGGGDIADVTAEIERMAGAGEEVFKAVEHLQAANADPLNLSLEDARERLAGIAEAIGGFGAELESIDAAGSAEEAEQAYANLRTEMLGVAEAGRVLRASQIETLREQLRATSDTEEQIKLVEKALSASNEELQRMADEAKAAENAANGVSSASRGIDFSGAANSAKALADQLGRALSNAQSLSATGIDSAERARIELDFDGDPVGKAAALARQRFDSQVGDLSGADSTVLNLVEQERRAFIDSEVEAERYRQKLSEVREERSKATKPSGGGGSKAKAKTSDEPSIFEISQEEIANLERQIELIGATDSEIAELTHRYMLLEEAKRRNLDLDQLQADTGLTLRQVIDAQAEAVGRLVEEHDDLADRREFQDQMVGQLKDGLLDAIVAGESFSDTLGNIGRQLAKVLLQAALFGEGPLATLFGQEAGKGLLSSLPFLAKGTPFHQGGPAVVGERGPEIVNLPRGAQVTPNHMIGPSSINAIKGGVGRSSGGAAASPDPQLDVAVLHFRSEQEFDNYLSSSRGRRKLKVVSVEEGIGGNRSR